MMEYVSLCRICLSNEVHKDISELQSHRDDNYSDIVLFCLNIKVEEDSKISTKLCSKCYKKIISFYKFKILALKNDAYLKTTESNGCIKNEIFLHDDIRKLEDSSRNSDDIGEDLIDIKHEPNDGDDSDSQSNELINVINNIKYEFVPESLKDYVEENAPKKTKAVKRGRPPKLRSSKKSKLASSASVPSAQVCDECGKTVKNLKEHLARHLPAGTRKRYPCSLCVKTFASYSARSRHKKTKHLGIKKACPICNKLVTSLSGHVRLTHRAAELPHECAHCGRRFISRSALALHVSVHTKDRPHACSKCDKKFRTNTALQTHTRQVHDKEKSHMCQFCSKSFFKKYHLQVHLRSHTKEKPYQCPECDKSFASSTILNNHRTVHSVLRQFECTLCTMTFARSGYLRAHMLSHTKEKKHPCHYCGVKFHRSDHRKRHEQNSHERFLVTSSINPKEASVTAVPATSPTTRPAISDLNAVDAEAIDPEQTLPNGRSQVSVSP